MQRYRKQTKQRRVGLFFLYKWEKKPMSKHSKKCLRQFKDCRRHGINRYEKRFSKPYSLSGSNVPAAPPLL